MLLAGIATVVVILLGVCGWCAFRFLKKKKPKGADDNLVSCIIKSFSMADLCEYV